MKSAFNRFLNRLVKTRKEYTLEDGCIRHKSIYSCAGHACPLTIEARKTAAADSLAQRVIDYRWITNPVYRQSATILGISQRQAELFVHASDNDQPTTKAAQALRRWLLKNMELEEAGTVTNGGGI